METPRSVAWARSARKSAEDPKYVVALMKSAGWTQSIIRKKIDAKVNPNLVWKLGNDPVLDRHCIHIEAKRRRGIQEQLPTWQTYAFYKADKVTKRKK